MNFRLIIVFALFALMAGAWFGTYVIYRAAQVGELVAPLEARRWEKLTVVAVGTGGSYENPERLGPATAVAWLDQVVLVDAGRGVTEALRTAQIPLTQPRTVLLTSLLPQNTMGLDDLIYTGWLRDRAKPVRVLGPAGTAKLVEGLLAAHREGAEALGHALLLPGEGRGVEVAEIDGSWSEEIEGMRISAGELSGGPLPALAYRFERGEKSIVVSSTGWGEDDLVRFAHKADMLVHEAAYIPGPDELEGAGAVADPERLAAEAEIHTSLLEVGDLATRADVATLVLVRLQPPPFFALQVRSIVANSYDGRISVPVDGDEVEP
jgi:ribonuclease BN (tRNA processing enzyme)